MLGAIIQANEATSGVECRRRVSRVPQEEPLLAWRFVTLRSDFGFDSFYCRPGIEGSH